MLNHLEMSRFFRLFDSAQRFVESKNLSITGSVAFKDSQFFQEALLVHRWGVR